ncbi:phage antirepressor KilAC domain-containing protein [Streptosporangium sp. NPDC004631]
MHNGTSPGAEGDGRGPHRELQLRGDPAKSPFEKIRQVDEGGEFWSARDLMPEMDYGQWRQFEDAIDRARATCRNSGFDVLDHFADARKITKNARGHRREVPDFRLTRYAAYLVAQNGDPRKAAIARAQTYFAIQTRKQEIAEQAAAQAPTLPAPRRELTNRELAAMVIEEADRADREAQLRIVAESKVAEMVPLVAEVEQHRAKAEYVDAFVDGRQDVTGFRVYCAQIQAPERKFRDHLINRGIIYRKVVSRRFDRAKQAWEPVHEYHPRADYKKWFHLKDQPEAPRHHNGQMRTTLYVTPLGKVKLLDWLKRHPLSGAA